MTTDFDLLIPHLNHEEKTRRETATAVDFSIPELSVDIRPCLTTRATSTTDQPGVGAGCVSPKDAKPAVRQRGTTSSNTAATDIVGAAPITTSGTDVESPLIDVNEFAAKLSCSTKHVRRMADSGRCPPAIRLGGCHRWTRQVVDDWIAAGCPVVRQPRACGRRK